MKKRVSTVVRRAMSMLAVGAMIVFLDAAVRSGQTAHADEWQFYLSSGDDYCEGCCTSGVCCELSEACKIIVEPM